MKSFKILIMFGILNLFNNCKTGNDVNDFQDDKFKVGQIWKYQNRTDEDNSKITILKVEKYNDNEIVIHIYVNGIKIKNELRPNEISEEIGHLPMSKESMNKSVKNLVSENNKLPDYKEGYKNWKEAFDKKEGGIFTIEIKEAVKFVEETMKSGKKTENN